MQLHFGCKGAGLAQEQQSEGWEWLAISWHSSHIMAQSSQLGVTNKCERSKAGIRKGFGD